MQDKNSIVSCWVINLCVGVQVSDIFPKLGLTIITLYTVFDTCNSAMEPIQLAMEGRLVVSCMKLIRLYRSLHNPCNADWISFYVWELILVPCECNLRQIWVLKNSPVTSCHSLNAVASKFSINKNMEINSVFFIVARFMQTPVSNSELIKKIA